MNTGNIFIRVLVAVVCFVLAMVLIPAVLDVLTVPVTDSLMLIIRVCCAALAVIYIVFGKPKGQTL